MSQQQKLLIVDDVEDNHLLLKDILQNLPCQISHAYDGIMALNNIEQEKPDLILLDILMPEMDGWEVCQQLKQSVVHKDIPIIFISALSENNEQIKGFSLGCVDYITKPFQKEEVEARVSTHLKLRAKEQELKKNNQELRKIREELEKANHELRMLSMLDELTQIANRRLFNITLKREWERAYRERSIISLLICDIDFFKQYNDKYGHQAGDTCLKKVAAVLMKSVQRSTDLVSRYGGEEFAIVLPDTDCSGANVVAEKIQELIKSEKIMHEYSSVSQHITLSIGVACFLPEDKDFNVLIQTADMALYQSKESGRNNIILWDN